MKFILQLFLSFLTTQTVFCHELLLDFLKFQDENSKVKLSKQCSNHINVLKNGVDNNELWAIKVRDASGKSGSNFLWGNNFWLGNEKACEFLNYPEERYAVAINPRRSYQNTVGLISKIPLEYRMFYASHTSPIQFDTQGFLFEGFQIGICFPKGCSESEIVEMSKIIFNSGEFKNSQIYGEVKFIKTKTLELRDDFFRDPFTKALL